MRLDYNTCQVCGKTYQRRRNIGVKEFEKQHTCGSQECLRAWNKARVEANIAEWKATHVRYCPCCGDLLVQRRDEKFYNFTRRVTCGKSGCRYKYGNAKRRGTVANLKPGVASIYDNEADAIQARINIDVAKHLHARSGMAFDAGRTLSKREVAELVKSGGITPIERISDRIVGPYFLT